MPARPDQDPATTWRKSRASADQGACVEIAVQGSFVLVRDARNTNGTVLRFTFGQWLELLRSIRKGELDAGRLSR
jgi:hypothetical protein